MKRFLSFLALVSSATLPCIAYAVTDADVDRSFFPYRDGLPTFPGLKPGMILTKQNVAPFKEAMDPGLFLVISNGWVDVKVGATTSFDLNQNYINATRANANKVKLGGKPGEISGFVAGRPFPEEPDPNDPRAGEKLAWNFRYSMNYGDTGTIYPFYWKYRDMKTAKVERTLKWNFHFLHYKHRVLEDPRPDLPDNPSQIYRATYALVEEPLDVKNTQVLVQRYEDDSKNDDAYLYLGFQRRVRRLASGQTTDAFLGTDIMVEDFESYNGRVSDYKWTYKGTANILLPFYNHDEQKLSDEYKEPDGYRFADFHGQGGCFADITWQLRKTYVLEGTPADPAHPISKRIYYMDAQTAALTRNVVFDRKGELWKINTVAKTHADHHLPQHKGKGVAIDDIAVMVDVQAMHCTTFQFKTQLDPVLSPARLFSVQNMRGAQ